MFNMNYTGQCLSMNKLRPRRKDNSSTLVIYNYELKFIYCHGLGRASSFPLSLYMCVCGVGVVSFLGTQLLIVAHALHLPSLHFCLPATHNSTVFIRQFSIHSSSHRLLCDSMFRVIPHVVCILQFPFSPHACLPGLLAY